MANSRNTNNSLTDLTNGKGQRFNTPLSEDNIPTINEREKLLSEISQLRRQRSNANDKEKESIDSRILDKQKELGDLDSTDSTELDDNSNLKSLFDRNASIDYGRYLNTDGSVTKNWKHYNSDDGVTFKNNSEITKKNEPVLYKDNTLKSDDGLSLPNLIEWSEKYPALQLKFQDFAYCKKLGYYPNNRLIVLRRFKAGVPDNLFDYVNTGSRVEFNQPLSTMITWWKPDEEIGDMTFSFKENWSEYTDGLMSSFKAVVSGITNGMVFADGEKKEDGANDLVTSILSDTIITDSKYRREDGTPYYRSSLGSPNLIAKAKARKIAGDGLNSNIDFKLKFEYEMRDINGIDPGIAMLDLISNCTRMGTSVSEFRYNIPALKESVGIKALVNGDIAKASEAFKGGLEELTNLVTDGFDNITNLISNNSGNGNNNKEKEEKAKEEEEKGIIKKTVSYIISRYRENLKAALSVDTGLPSGVWHVTIGNPKSPIISCGDLIISQSTLKLGKELGYNDFPNEFSVTYTLESARPRGRDELNRIFNAGRGRVYVYPKVTNNPDYDLYDNTNFSAEKDVIKPPNKNNGNA